MAPKKRKVVGYNRSDVLPTRTDDENDGDRAFLMSLLPELKRIPPERRAELKIKMLVLVSETVYGKSGGNRGDGY